MAGRDVRHTTGHTIRHASKGRIQSTGGLSEQQRAVLTWIAAHERPELGRVGQEVVFSFKNFLDNKDVSVSAAERASLSRTVARLAQRGLLERIGKGAGGPAALVRLTPTGRAEALRLLESDGMTTAEANRERRQRQRAPKAYRLLEIFRAANVPVEMVDGRLELVAAMTSEEVAVAASIVAAELAIPVERIRALLDHRTGPISRELDLAERARLAAAHADTLIVTYLRSSLQNQRGPRSGLLAEEWERRVKPGLDRSAKRALNALWDLGKHDDSALRSAQANLFSALLEVVPTNLHLPLNELSIGFELAAEADFDAKLASADDSSIP